MGGGRGGGEGKPSSTNIRTRAHRWRKGWIVSRVADGQEAGSQRFAPCDLARLRAAYWASPNRRAGGDGGRGGLRETWRPTPICTGAARGRYRQASRRAYIPKADGRSRPLGIAGWRQMSSRRRGAHAFTRGLRGFPTGSGGAASIRLGSSRSDRRRKVNGLDGNPEFTTGIMLLLRFLGTNRDSGVGSPSVALILTRRGDRCTGLLRRSASDRTVADDAEIRVEGSSGRGRRYMISRFRWAIIAR